MLVDTNAVVVNDDAIVIHLSDVQMLVLGARLFTWNLIHTIESNNIMTHPYIARIKIPMSCTFIATQNSSQHDWSKESYTAAIYCQVKIAMSDSILLWASGG